MQIVNSIQPLRGLRRTRGWVRLLVPLVLILVCSAPASAQLTSPSTYAEAGDFLPAAAVTFPSAPSVPQVTIRAEKLISLFAGNWIDVDLNLPATLTAYEGEVPVRTMNPIIGRAPLYTPEGTFSIIRRVASETMDSSTIGIPRDGPDGYYLTNVLFTQYFTGGGASIHYNYWSTNWGYPGSHGCLGLSYDDAAFMWNFADLGTVVSIHY